MNTDPDRFDVAIVGGGMVGASLALALRDTPLRCVLIEAQLPGSAAQPSFDERTTALGNGSRRVFEALGAWPGIAAEAAHIRHIHVSDAGRYGFARLDATELGLEALGYVVANRVIGRQLWAGLAQCAGLTILAPARLMAARLGADEAQLDVETGGAPRRLRARLVVAADGAHSLVRTAAGIDADVKDYGQTALVAALQTDRAGDGTAYERFASSGPLAVLPVHPSPGSAAGGYFTAIWALAPALAQELAAIDARSFCSRLQRAFGWRIGELRQVGARGCYPLALTRAKRVIGERTLLIGNAAQSLHPVAGQGFNLGLRDVAQLAELLAAGAATEADAFDPGAAAFLQRFAEQRAADRSGITRFTDTLVGVFGDTRGGMAPLRNLALLLFDVNAPAKRALAGVSLGLGARAPRLVRGLPLR